MSGNDSLPFQDTEQAELLDELNGPTHPIIDYSQQPRNCLRDIILRTHRIHMRSRRPLADPVKFWNAFLSLPTDIGSETFSHLHPIDLYHFSLTSKPLRRMLLSSDSADIWTRSFEAHSNYVPPCPPKCSGTRWAVLLFGPLDCEACGSTKGWIDFGLLQKLCRKCLGELTVSEADAVKMCLRHPHSVKRGRPKHILPLCRRSYTIDALWGPGGRLPSTDSCFLIEGILSNIPFACAECNPMREQSLQTWRTIKDEIIEEVAAKNSCALESQLWALKLRNDMEGAGERSFLKRCKRLLLKAGFTPWEVESADTNMTHHFHSFTSLLPSNKELRGHMVTLHELLVDVRRRALASELQNGVSATYRQYRRTAISTERIHCPEESAIKVLMEARQLGLSSGSANPLIQPLEKSKAEIQLLCSSLEEQLPSAIAQWREENRQKVLNELYIGGGSDLLAIFSTTGEQGNQIPESAVDLAVSVFSCLGCTKLNRGAGDAVTGRDGVLTHLAVWNCGKGCCVWSHEGHAAAVSLLEYLGANPRTTTATEMDQLDARFFCVACTMKCRNKGSDWGYPALTWRECIVHVIKFKDDAGHPTPRWHRLTIDATNYVKAHERHERDPSYLVWECVHCSEFKMASLSAVFEHLLRSHGISVPEDKRDFIHVNDELIRQIYRIQRKPFFYILDPPNENRCLLCRTDLPVRRLWNQTMLIGHIIKSHSIPVEEISEGRHFEKVSAF